MSETEITLGSYKVTKPSLKDKRFALMLWGSSGSGKTTLAATAPGKKLWINFDPDGTNSIMNRDDVIEVDLSAEKPIIIEKMIKENPLKIEQMLEEHPDVETVVFDSLTTFGELALLHGVTKAQSTAKGKKSTLEDPGFAGYGNKNTWVRKCVMELLASTARQNRNIIFIAHEDKPVTNDQGVVMYISIMLGSSLNEQLPIKLSEIWNLTDTGKERRIAVRNSRSRKPMKSRMFITSGDPEFVWHFDADELEGEGIAAWYEQWKANDGKKIPLP